MSWQLEQVQKQARERIAAEQAHDQIRMTRWHNEAMLDETRRQTRALEKQENSLQTAARWVIMGVIGIVYVTSVAVTWAIANWQITATVVGVLIAVGVIAIKLRRKGYGG